MESNPQPVPHVHHYVPKGSGLSCWAECDVVCFYGVGSLLHYMRPCGKKLAGDNGAIAGSLAKIERAIRDAA